MPSRRNQPTSIIVLSPAEVAFLTKVTNGMRAAEEISPELKSVLHDRLVALRTPDDNELDRLVFTVSGPEIEQLHRITKAAYSFVTEGERRARLVLREKMAVASDELGITLS
jgi:hypothetical protein